MMECDYFMFNEDKNIAAAQKVMLDILIEGHKICVKHNITYWLEAGTLLGAVRHKGFIPWDDDCDISMPREDYEKFLEIAQNELPKNMFLQTKYTDPECTIRWAKVRKNGTLLIQKNETGKENFHHGIFIDIFPYDGYKYGFVLRMMEWLRTFKDKKNKYPKKSFIRILVTIYTNIIMCIPVQITVAICNYLIRNKGIICDDTGKYFTYGLECENVRVTKKTDVLPVRLNNKVFEGYNFYVPNKPQNVLKANFGTDFMTLPPVEKRETHAVTIKL